MPSKLYGYCSTNVTSSIILYDKMLGNHLTHEISYFMYYHAMHKAFDLQNLHIGFLKI